MLGCGEVAYKAVCRERRAGLKAALLVLPTCPQAISWANVGLRRHHLTCSQPAEAASWSSHSWLHWADAEFLPCQHICYRGSSAGHREKKKKCHIFHQRDDRFCKTHPISTSSSSSTPAFTLTAPVLSSKEFLSNVFRLHLIKYAIKCLHHFFLCSGEI